MIDVGTGVVDWDMNARASSKDVSIAIIGRRSKESDESFDIGKTRLAGESGPRNAQRATDSGQQNEKIQL